MKTKIIYKDFQVNNVPMETVIFDESGNHESCILLDDVNEKRWKIKIKNFCAIKIMTNESACLNFFKGGDFEDGCFIDGEDHPDFLSFIMEVETSKWIEDIKSKRAIVTPNDDYMSEIRHFLIPCYDNIIEILAKDIELEEVTN